MKDQNVPKVTIIIPFYRNAENLEECIEHCLDLNYPDFEVIVITNRPLGLPAGVMEIVTDELGQTQKKDLGASRASGDLCAFIDDDAYPDVNWIANAVGHFADPAVMAVGGPGLTPPDDGPQEKAGGLVYSSPLGGGTLSHRYVGRETRKVNELPGYNLFVRCSYLADTGGFGVRYRSGEDTLLSQRILAAGKKILYAPDVVVYHHRRPLFRAHLRQVATYALHRGYFAKKYPHTSARVSHLAPMVALFLLALWVAAAASFPFLRLPLLIVIIGYPLLCFGLALLESTNLVVSSLVGVGIPLTHIAYALFFIKGLVTRELGERPSY
jgi:GT2 family glycosyltransferase